MGASIMYLIWWYLTKYQLYVGTYICSLIRMYICDQIYENLPPTHYKHIRKIITHISIRLNYNFR